MREFQHKVTTPDGVTLSVRECLPDAGPALRNLLFLHGVSEHGGRYVEFSQAATADGWRVIIPDHRGHGLSSGARVHIREFQQYLNDVRLICRHFSLDPHRTAIVGHSMGGLVTARLLETGEPAALAACLLSPYLGSRVHIDAYTLFLGRILSVVWPTFQFRTRVKAVDLSVDEEYLRRRREDKLIARAVTARWYFAVQIALRQVHADAARIHTPLLIVQGDADKVVDPDATQAWFNKLRQTDRTLQILPGRRHELLQEPDRVETTRYVLQWLDERISGAAKLSGVSQP